MSVYEPSSGVESGRSHLSYIVWQPDVRVSFCRCRNDLISQRGEESIQIGLEIP